MSLIQLAEAFRPRPLHLNFLFLIQIQWGGGGGGGGVGAKNIASSKVHGAGCCRLV